MPRQTSENENPENPSKNTTGSKTDDDTASNKKNQAMSSTSDAFSALRQSHREMTDLLDTIKKKTPEKQKDNIEKLITRWFQHSQLEEELLIPEIEMRNIESADLLEGEIKRDIVKVLAVNLQADDTNNAEDAAILHMLDALIRQLIEAEEKPNTGLFARIQTFNISDLEEKISQRMKQIEQEDVPSPVLHHLFVQSFLHNKSAKENNMTNRERDAQGRFVSDDDRRYGSSRRMDDDDRNDRRYGRSDDDDRRSGGGGRYSSSGRDYDDRRSSNRDYDDDRRSSGRSYSSRSREDEGYSRDRGQGGWFGDSEGHAEAARRGWDERRSDDDDNRRSSGGGRSGYSGGGRSYDDDNRRSGSSGGRSYSSRSREDEGYSRDRGQGGWFGDSEGHAEAARRGWDERRSDDDDNRRGGRSSRMRDDDDRRSGGRYN